MNQKKKRKPRFVDVKLTRRQIKLILLSSLSETRSVRRDFEEDELPGWVKEEEAGQRRMQKAIERYDAEIS